MKSKRKRIISGTVITALVLLAAICLPRVHAQKKQTERCLTPLIREANLLSASIRGVTGKKNNDIAVELDAVKERFASFETVALDTKNMTTSEIEGFEDFASVLVHCRERIRVMADAGQNGEPPVPDEITFLNALNDGVCELTDALQNENGTMRVSGARQYSKVIAAFAEAIRKSEK